MWARRLPETFKKPVGNFAAAMPWDEVCGDQRCIQKKSRSALRLT